MKYLYSISRPTKNVKQNDAVTYSLKWTLPLASNNVCGMLYMMEGKVVVEREGRVTLQKELGGM
jgi:hypothetical protein